MAYSEPDPRVPSDPTRFCASCAAGAVVGAVVASGDGVVTAPGAAHAANKTLVTANAAMRIPGTVALARPIPMLIMNTPPRSLRSGGQAVQRSSSTALLRRRRGRTNRQLRYQSNDGRLIGWDLDLGQQDLRAPATGLEQLLANGRQSDVVGGFDVV